MFKVGDRVAITNGLHCKYNVFVSPFSNARATVYITSDSVAYIANNSVHLGTGRSTCYVCLDESGESFVFEERSLSFVEHSTLEQLLTHPGREVRQLGIEKQEELCQKNVSR